MALPLEQDINWDLLSVDDLQAYVDGRYDDMSVDALKYVTGEGFGAGEIAQTAAGQGFSSTLRGLAEYVPFLSVDKEADLEAERRLRMMQETNPVQSNVWALLGGIVDPVTLPAFMFSPIKIGGAVATGAARGVAAGAGYGALEPVYEEFDDSRLVNTAVGATIGGAFGGVAGALGKWLKGKGAKTVTELTPETRQEFVKGLDDQSLDEFLETGKKALQEQKDKGVEVPRVEGMTEEELTDLVNQEKQTRAIPGMGETGAKLRQNEQTGDLELVTMETPDIDLKLPAFLGKPKPRMGSVQLSWDSETDLDNVFYTIGNPRTKSKRHDEFVEWVVERTGLTAEEVVALARKAHAEVMTQVKAAKPKANTTFNVQRTSVTQELIDRARQPIERVEPYVPPSNQVVMSRLSTRETDFLNNVMGIEMSVDKNGRTLFRHNRLPRKPFVSLQQVNEALNKVGIKYERRPKNKLPDNAEDLVDETLGEDVIPGQFGSVGAAATRPSKLYDNLLSSALDDLQTDIDELKARVATGTVTAGKSVKERVSGKAPAVAVRARKIIQDIKKNYADAMDYIVKNKLDKVNLLDDAHVRAFKPLVRDAQQRREAIMDKLEDMVATNQDLDTREVAEMWTDLLYYHSIDLWWRDQGTMVARALAQRRNFTSRLDYQVKHGVYDRDLPNLFPLVSC